jgi:Na+/glutamate symporter
MSDGLKANGFTALVALPIAMFVIHSFFGYPLTSMCLKREGRIVLEDFRKNGKNKDLIRKVEEEKTDIENSKTKKLIPPLPEAYQTTAMILFKLMIVGIISSWLSNLTGGALNQYVICLILGVIFCHLGFLEESALVKAGVFGWLITGLLLYVFSGLSAVTPQGLGKILVPIIGKTKY